MTKNGLTAYQVKELQDDVRSLQRDVNSILTNHLPHIQEDLISLKTRVNLLTALNIGAVILGVIFSKIL